MGLTVTTFNEPVAEKVYHTSFFQTVWPHSAAVHVVEVAPTVVPVTQVFPLEGREIGLAPVQSSLATV